MQGFKIVFKTLKAWREEVLKSYLRNTVNQSNSRGNPSITKRKKVIGAVSQNFSLLLTCMLDLNFGVRKCLKAYLRSSAIPLLVA